MIFGVTREHPRLLYFARTMDIPLMVSSLLSQQEGLAVAIALVIIWLTVVRASLLLAAGSVSAVILKKDGVRLSIVTQTRRAGIFCG